MYLCCECGKKMTHKQSYYVDRFFFIKKKGTSGFGKQPICKGCLDKLNVILETD